MPLPPLKAAPVRLIALLALPVLLALVLAAPASAQPLAVDFSTATGFGGGSLTPLEFQINGIRLDNANPFDPTQVNSFTFNVKWRFDNNPASPTFLHLIPVGVVQTGGTGSTTQRGTITVTVNSATNGQPISGATVSQAGGGSATTNSTGQATFTDVPAGGAILFTASAQGFLSSSASITPVPNQTVPGTISLPPADATLGSGFRIVLNWGTNPADLDSHITGPQSSGTDRFHIYYANSNRAGSSTTPTAANSSLPFLDVDDTTSFGPETITINQTALRAGTYRYSIHHFSGSSTICTSASEIRVNVYRGTTLVRTFSPPATGCVNGSGNVWTVFTIDGATGNVTPVNTYSGPTSASAVQKPYAGAIVESESPDVFLNLPAKP